MAASQFTEESFPTMVIFKSDARQCKVRLAFEVVATNAVDHVAALAAFIDIDCGHGDSHILRNSILFTSAASFFGVAGQEYMAEAATRKSLGSPSLYLRFGSNRIRLYSALRLRIVGNSRDEGF